VIPEVVNQIAFKVIGNDLAVTLAAEAGQLELNVMEPLIAQSILESIEILRNGILTLETRCVRGIQANREVCLAYVRNSIGLVTALVPILGYEVATVLARDALMYNRGIYELVLERGLLSEEALTDILDPRKMVGPQT
jgi:aspartate ammonia-lyase